MKTILQAVAILLSLFAIIAGFQIYTNKIFVGEEVKWAIGIYKGKDPFNLEDPKAIQNPVLTKHDISDITAKVVADPFLIRDNDLWYMFFEVLNRETNTGDIGLAISPDGEAWTYQKIVLDEPYHLSYPLVLKHQNHYYMIPESGADGNVKLYRAKQFPDQWELVSTLIEGHYFADPTPLFHQNRWWLFVSERTHSNLYLYSAKNLEGPYTKHPQSPIIRNDPSKARPAGRIIRYQDKLIRIAQQCTPWYGHAVNAFEIITLTADTYEEQPFKTSLIKGDGEGWNATKMHQYEVIQNDHGEWIGAVDGGGGKDHYHWIKWLREYF